MRAKVFKHDCENIKDSNKLLINISEFLKSPSGNCHTYSLKSYIIRELGKSTSINTDNLNLSNPKDGSTSKKIAQDLANILEGSRSQSPFQSGENSSNWRNFLLFNIKI